MTPRQVALLLASATARAASELAMRANSYLPIGVSDDRDIRERNDLVHASESLRSVASALQARADKEN